MFDFFFGLALGLGIGAYNAEKGLRDCLDGTFHLTKQKAIEAKTNAGPLAKQMQDKALPYVKQVSSTIQDRMGGKKPA